MDPLASNIDVASDRALNAAFTAHNYRTLVRVVLSLAIPAIAQLIIQSLVFVADRIMLGHYSIAALASLEISNLSINCSVQVLCFFTVGLVAVVGRATGAKDRDLATSAIVGGIWYTSIISIAFSVVAWLNLPVILSLFPGLEIAVREAALHYLEIAFLGFPLLMLSMVATAILQAMGNTRTPFFVGAIANIINIGINYCLIFGHYHAPSLGVRGAAIGTVAALAIEALLLLGIIARQYNFLSRESFRDRTVAIGQILSISSPVFWERLIRQLGIAINVVILTFLGKIAISTFEAISSFESFIESCANGFSIAAAVIVAQSLGAKKTEIAVSGSLIAMIFVASLSALYAGGFFLFPDRLFSVFLPKEPISIIGIHSFYIAAIEQLFMALSVFMTQVLQIRGDTKIVTAISLIGWLIVRFCAVYLFVFVLNLGLVGFWLGLTCDWFVRVLALGVLFFQQQRWQQDREG
ncbi:MAG: MATE family efflux transporter [Cyanobacteria bacterium SBLK]|nr:MATE family efflux transporter [Cyanobacteria bacterium SBLK]